MNKEKINEVGELLDVDYSEIKESKVKQIRKKLIFPIVQLSNFIFTSISGALFGFWENKANSSYPYSSLIPRIYGLGILTILGLNTGNAIISKKIYKNAGLKKTYTILIVFLNLIVSAASFVLLYIAIENVPTFTVSVDYDTYRGLKL